MPKDLLVEGSIFGIGNPLLDISANVTDEFLKKWQLPKNGAILAEKTQENLYEDLINNFQIDYTAGGACQNTMRFIQWIIGKNTSVTTFVGCIGNDYFGRMMEKKAKTEGVKVLYSVEKEKATGTCAVLVTDNGRSRTCCAYLGAAEHLKKEDIIRNWHWVDKARVYYMTGHSLSVTPDSVLAIAKQTNADRFQERKFMFNLAATYVSEKFGKQLMEIYPYVDFIFGNEEETLAFAKMRGYGTEDFKEIAKKMANEPKETKGPRTAIVTQGPKPIVVARTGSNKIEEFAVPQLEDDKIVDTNGAGDALTGGFLAMYIQEKPFEVCIKCGIYCANECIQRQGVTYPKTFNFKA